MKNNRIWQFSHTKNIRCVNIEIIFCASSIKDAFQVLDVNKYYFKNNVHKYKATDLICIKYPGVLFSRFNSGEFFSCYPKEVNAIFTYDQMITKINMHRQKYPTYKDYERINKRR